MAQREPQSQVREEPKEQIPKGEPYLPYVQQPIPIPQSYECMLPSKPSSTT
jgi:hypothetical protein